MNPITSILAGTDFSADSNNAVRRAALLAREHGARLYVVHVLRADGCKPLRDWFAPTTDMDLKAAQARETLRRIAVKLAGDHDVTATVEVMVGDPLAMLMQASRDVDLVVLGQQGHSRLETLLIGRTTDRMLRTSRRPVLVVKRAAVAGYRRPLATVDFTPSSDDALRFAAGLLRRTPLHVFHATDTHVESMLRRADVAESTIRSVRASEEIAVHSRLRRSTEDLGLGDQPMAYSVGYGLAEWATLGHARTIGSDLIVAGKRGRSTFGGFLLGSVSSRVLAESDCDVLIVPRPHDATPTRPAWSVARGRDKADALHSLPEVTS